MISLTPQAVKAHCGAIDLVCGGFPCQDVSLIGKGEGLAGKRSGLWHEMRRVIRGVRPRWLLIENVIGLRSRTGWNLRKPSVEPTWTGPTKDEHGYHCGPMSTCCRSHVVYFDPRSAQYACWFGYDNPPTYRMKCSKCNGDLVSPKP